MGHLLFAIKISSCSALLRNGFHIHFFFFYQWTLFLRAVLGLQKIEPKAQSSQTPLHLPPTPAPPAPPLQFSLLQHLAQPGIFVILNEPILIHYYWTKGQSLHEVHSLCSTFVLEKPTLLILLPCVSFTFTQDTSLLICLVTKWVVVSPYTQVKGSVPQDGSHPPSHAPTCK